MPRLLVHVQAFVARHRDEEGSTAAEYALVVGLIALVIVGAVSMLGAKLTSIFSALLPIFP